MPLTHATLLDVGALLIALLVILGSAELFTNGVEWLGQKLQLSEGVVGSVLAAVGTALPETLIPIVAVCVGHSEHHHQVGIGAIAGAPFMLSTLTMCVCGLSIMIFSRKGKRSGELNVNRTVLSRDLTFFILAYGAALLGVFAREQLIIKQILAVALILTYGLYLKKTFAHEGEVGEAPEVLHFDRLKMGTHMGVVILQIIAGLIGIVIGAYVFVEHTKTLAEAIDVPAVILSMIVAPIATELPEKFNSVLWARSGKDTLALGNITGALVFQSCFPVAFGLAFTSWDLGPGTLISGVVAISCATFFLVLLRMNKLKFQHLIMGGVCYAATIGWLMINALTD